MKRSPLVRKTPLRSKPRHQPSVEREPKPMARLEKAPNYAGSTTGPVEKDKPVRSEAYRRLVASMPCCWCLREGMSQAAHPNHGKGMSLKTDDRRCFPLCLTCHPEFDQGKRLTREERRFLADGWERETRAAILSAGKWPANVPKWKEEA